MQPTSKKYEDDAMMLIAKEENRQTNSAELCNNNHEISRQTESTEREVREAAGCSAARFSRRELDYIAEMYCDNYEIFHKSSTGGGRAKEAIALKRKLLQEMADYLSSIADERRTVMQVDQKIRDEVRQVKKYLRFKRLDLMGNNIYPREIRLSSSQQYIADKLRLKRRLHGIDHFELDKLTETAVGLLSQSGAEGKSDHAAASSSPPNHSFPADTTSLADPSPYSIDTSLCSYSDYRRSKEMIPETMEELQKESLRADIDCARTRMEAAMEERRYWEERRHLLALERQMLLDRHPLKQEESQDRDRIAVAAGERLYWEEKRRMMAFKKQCMLEKLD